MSSMRREFEEIRRLADAGIRTSAADEIRVMEHALEMDAYAFIADREASRPRMQECKICRLEVEFGCEHVGTPRSVARKSEEDDGIPF